MHASDFIAVFSGLVVGVSLGLTGGGGSIFAVPLLVYALGLAPTAAIGLSLGIVGLTAGFGAALRLGRSEIDWTSGLVFAASGMALAPVGAWCGHLLPPAVLLSGFALLMLVVGTRMWRAREEAAPAVRAYSAGAGWGRRAKLLAAGSAAGVLAGLFGIGGGFIIVPALLYATGMSVHRAIATSLLVIFLISLAGVGASLRQGADWPWVLAGLFLAGGLGGMAGGSALRSRLPAHRLRRIFAAGMWLVAAFMLVKNVPALLAAAPRPGAA